MKKAAPGRPLAKYLQGEVVTRPGKPLESAGTKNVVSTGPVAGLPTGNRSDNAQSTKERLVDSVGAGPCSWGAAGGLVM
ncbi:MAG: hypothetical protein CMJ81_17935 [Planctomycetaceae bacterium]|nr:hypothetical protein [Planctomycetaceae bacterium]MBP61352.1 hypothetical protein [Planctomycetaceae bacterium]